MPEPLTATGAALLTPWKLAMAVILPLMGGKQRFRTWGAMLLASIAALGVPVGYPPCYIAIDLLAGALILVRPAGIAQRMIGLLFACMVMFHAGFWLATVVNPITPSIRLYLAAQRWVGWAQWAILLGWGAYDAWESLAGRRRADRRALAAEGRV